MQRFELGTVLFALLLAPLGCGGESSSDGSGGSGGSSGNGGATGGGGGAPGGGGGASGGIGGASGGSGGASGGSGGTGACGELPGGMDCIHCGGFTLPICKNGAWTCPPDTNCPLECPSGQVPVGSFCLTCAFASQQLSAAIEVARKANAACGTAADCVLTGAGTKCAGSCQVAVSKSGEAAFTAKLGELDIYYCSDFVPVCGYSTPKCALPTLECTAGTCEAKFN